MTHRSCCSLSLSFSLSLLLALVPLAGCPLPDLGDAPFFCNNGAPLCPEGYQCRAKVCIREGALPDLGLAPEPDQAGQRPSDAASAVDQRVTLPPDLARTGDQRHGDQRPPDHKVTSPDQSPATVQVQISEFMANPLWAWDDDHGEWLELHNLGATQVDINGWTLKDANLDKHVIAGALPIPAKGYLVLGRSTDVGYNGGAPVAYSYGGTFTLANTADEIILLNKAGVVVDSVSYSTTSGWTIPSGSSLSLKKTAGANHSDPANWCREMWPWKGSDGDEGTPGEPPGC